MIAYGFADYLRLMWQLIRADLIVYRKGYFAKLIDYAIWVLISVVVLGYLMTDFGLDSRYGAFTAATMAGVAGVMSVYPCVANLVMDLEGERLISYHLTLPIPPYLIFVKQIVYESIATMAVGIFMLPLGMVCVYNQFDYSLISLPKFLLIFVVSAVFFSSFTLWIANFVKGIRNIEMIWTRIMFPLWFLGGFQFTWAGLYKKSPWFAYCSLANPFFYVTEGTRAAILGQPGSLNYWLCVGMLIVMTLLCGWWGITRLCKRLDTV